jgi:hypothetical protein
VRDRVRRREHRLDRGRDRRAVTELDEPGGAGQGAGLAVAVAPLVALATTQGAADGEAGGAGDGEEQQGEGCHGIGPSTILDLS